MEKKITSKKEFLEAIQREKERRKKQEARSKAKEQIKQR